MWGVCVGVSLSYCFFNCCAFILLILLRCFKHLFTSLVLFPVSTYSRRSRSLVHITNKSWTGLATKMLQRQRNNNKKPHLSLTALKGMCWCDGSEVIFYSNGLLFFVTEFKSLTTVHFGLCKYLIGLWSIKTDAQGFMYKGNWRI